MEEASDRRAEEDWKVALDARALGRDGEGGRERDHPRPRERSKRVRPSSGRDRDLLRLDPRTSGVDPEGLRYYEFPSLERTDGDEFARWASNTDFVVFETGS